ncbi:hypothetical protein ECBP5_0007 [Escherichia phage ECBP5]|uniref:Uncharacterized protein n=1 Tax=Escherichia phage ECBP5 TaxID=1498172 RepID=A0A0F6N5R5_9CAUD|nr:hypothetical protein ECBP5_0007 [Escherichia phage ECBP5]AID17661.1 hypothetical protein ECBP5_0007 [Escherichia phage ECBP5]
MENFKVTELDDEFIIIQEYAWQRPETITVSITETDEAGNTKLVKEWKEQRKPENKELLADIYIFNKSQLDMMRWNYQLGNCPITQKGLRRYSLAYGSGNNWFGCPARTAKQMLKRGVAIPKELYGLFTHVNGAY